MIKLRTRLLVSFILLIFLNLVLLFGSTLWGYKSSKAKWNDSIQRISNEGVASLLREVYSEFERIDPQKIEEKARKNHYTLQSVYSITWFSKNQKRLFSWSNKSLKTDKGRSIKMTIQPFFYQKGEINYLLGYYQVVLHPDLKGLVNLDFLNIMLKISLLGLLFSILLSVILSTKMAYLFSGNILFLNRSLTQIAKGNRSISFPKAKSIEMQGIFKATQSLQEQLKQEDIKRSRWSLNIAHDLRTPVTALRTQCTACKEGVFTLDEKRWSIIFKEIDNLESIIEGFSYITYLESLQAPPDIKQIQWTSIQSQLEKQVGSLCQAQGHKLVWSVSVNEFESSYALLLKALEALLTNACQYAPKGSTIHIKVESFKDSTLFAITNPGSLEKKHQQYIWDPLYKGDESRGLGGTGLGLTKVKLIAEILGAKCQASFKENIVFSLLIPKVK